MKNKKLICSELILSVLPLIRRRHRHINVASLLTHQEIILLVAISKNPQMPASFYGEELSVPKSRVTALSNNLVKHGYVSRRPCENDRRVVMLEITHKGKEALDENKRIMHESMIEHLNKFSDEDIDRLIHLIEEFKYIFEKYDVNAKL